MLEEQLLTDLQNRMADYISQFLCDGVLVLPGFFDDGRLRQVLAATDCVKHIRPMDVVIDNLENGERTVLGLMTAKAVWHDRMKINDLYLSVPEVREMALDRTLVRILFGLLGQVPSLCNSLYLEKGSSQDRHVDSLYMTPRSQGHLVAAWVALEDVHEAAGPLEFFPGSHLIKQKMFNNGTYHANDEEMLDWSRYMTKEVKKAKIKPQRFIARAGDVLVWHAHLLHGGAPIEDYTKTRKSCVFHYFSEADARAAGEWLVPMAGAYWIDRAPQSLPASVIRKLPFSEHNYVRRYKDVAAAVVAGHFASGFAHYERFGQAEGRLPV